MGNLAGVKRDFRALERRRMQAARFLERGWNAAAVARRVGVHRQSVNRWAKQLADSGRAVVVERVGDVTRHLSKTDRLVRVPERLEIVDERVTALA